MLIASGIHISGSFYNVHFSLVFKFTRIALGRIVDSILFVETLHNVEMDLFLELNYLFFLSVKNRHTNEQFS